MIQKINFIPRNIYTGNSKAKPKTLLATVITSKKVLKAVAGTALLSAVAFGVFAVKKFTDNIIYRM
jgi:hypothetical protein